MSPLDTSKLAHLRTIRGRRCKFRVLIIAAQYKIKFFYAMAKYLPREFQCRVISAEEGYRGKGTGFLVAKNLIRTAMSFKPDLVFTDYPAHPSWHAKLYATLSGRHVPLVALLRGDVWTEYTDYFRNARLPTKLLGPFYIFAWSTGIQFADRILSICSWLNEIVAERYPNKKTGILHEGIDPEPWLVPQVATFPFKRPAVGILQDNNILPKVKGLLWFSNVVREMPNVNFYVAGGGAYTPLVEKTFSDLQNVHFLGRVPYPEGVSRFHRSTDVYVLPSGLDCCPATLLEASLCERPVVASRVGGIPELVEEGKTGWTLPNGQKDLWVAKIHELLENPRLSEAIGANGHNFVLDNFSWQKQASRLASIFSEELRSH